MPVGVRKLPASPTPLRRCDASRRSPSGSRRGCGDRCPKGRPAPPLQRQAPQLGYGPSPPSHLIDGTAPREGSVPAAVGRWPRRRGAADAEAVAWSPPTHPGIGLAAPPDHVHAEPGDLRLPGLKECSGSRSVVDAPWDSAWHARSSSLRRATSAPSKPGAAAHGVTTAGAQGDEMRKADGRCTKRCCSGPPAGTAPPRHR